jgi:putative oxidoreductase
VPTATSTAQPTADSTVSDLGLLVLRTGVGAVIFAHGAFKLFGWFGKGGGLDATGAGFESIGFTPGRTNALVAGVTEAGGGALLAAGLATPAAAAAAAGTLVVAASFHAPSGFFFGDGGLEFPATLALTAVAIGITGPGGYSADALLGRPLDRPWMRAAALALVAPAAGTVIWRRGRTLAARAADAPAPNPDTDPQTDPETAGLPAA